MKQERLTRLIVAITMIFFISITAALAQGQVQLQLLTRNPMPERISDWRRDPSLIQLRITNPAGNQEYRDVRVSFEVKDVRTGKVVIHSKDGDPRIPTITVGKGYSSTTLFGRDLIDPSSVEIDPSVRTIALATNSLPEGNYSFCIRLLNGAGEPIPTIGGCANLTILHPRPPTLVLPSDHQVFLPGQLPNFQWTPAQRVTGSYRLKIVPVYQNQSGQNAIQVNPPVLDKNVGSLLGYQYLASDPSFTNYFGLAYGFAWQVSITDPLTGQTYESTVHHFTFGSNSPLVGMQNIANGSWIIPWNPGNGGNGGGGNGGGNGGGGNGGNGGNNQKGVKDLGNIGTVQSTCDKPRSFRIWMNFGNMGFNTFPMDVLGISGVDPTVADVSYDASGKITIKCKNTGTFTIDLWIRALPLGLSPFKDVYKVSITIDCRCGKPGNGKGKKGKGDDDNESGDDDSGKDRGANDGSENGSGSENGGDDPAANDDPCKKLKELEGKISEAETKLKEAEEDAQKAAQAAANPDQAKKECEESAKKGEEELNKLNKEINDLRNRQEQLLKQIREIHQKDGVNFGWSYNSATGELTYGAIVDGNFVEGIVPSAWNQVKELEKVNKQLKEKLAERNRKQAEVEKQKEDCKDLEKKLKEEREEKMEEVDKAVDELEKLREEYERLKKDCEKKNSGDTGDEKNGGDDNSGESGTKGSESGGSGTTTGGDTDGGAGTNGANGDANATTDDPCEKLKEVEKQLEELKREIEQAGSEKGNLSELEDAKAELESELEKAESDLDRDWKIWEKLGKMTDEAFRKHGENSDEYKNLKRNRDNYLAKIQKHQDRIRELKKRLKEAEEKLAKAKEAAEREEKARQELEELSKEYERLKRECDKPGSSSSGSGDGTTGGKSTDDTKEGESGKSDGQNNSGGTSGVGVEGGELKTGGSNLLDENDPCEKLAEVEDRIRETEKLLAESKQQAEEAKKRLAELQQQLERLDERISKLKEKVLEQGVDKTTPEYQEWERLIGERVTLEGQINRERTALESAEWSQSIWEKALQMLRDQQNRLKKECENAQGSGENRGEDSSSEGEETEHIFSDGFESGDVNRWSLKADVAGVGRGNLNPQGIDCSKIVASRGTGATGGMIIVGRPGSVPPNSTVTITDANGKSVTVTAGADGSFRAVEADLPDGFDHTVGNTLTVTVGGRNCEVTIQR